MCGSDSCLGRAAVVIPIVIGASEALAEENTRLVADELACTVGDEEDIVQSERVAVQSSLFSEEAALPLNEKGRAGGFEG